MLGVGSIVSSCDDVEEVKAVVKPRSKIPTCMHMIHIFDK